ncbi:hypothetical protein R9C00_19600 [Flammeovirgaceae bacterium SG7u.111]|nr:hypothetical protein [Flammeovirgaceae bacterium SG7u.132]WPO33907.1 hypothetical protein R9C00_19600 [Flammeovirgaceae bacterium SG7u.111]
MKKNLLLILAIHFVCQFANAQDQNLPLNNFIGFVKPDGSERFTYNGQSIGQYSLGWYNLNLSSPEARMSGYGGIKFFTNMTPRLSITKSGFLGVGTTTPEAKFEIQHTGTIGGKWNPSSSYFKLSDGSISMIMDNNEIYTNNSLNLGASNDIKLSTVDASSSTLRFIITNAGKVGVGTSSPKATFHVNGDYYGKGHMFLHAYEGEGSSGTAYIQARDFSNSSNINLRFRTQQNGVLNEVMILTPNGRVGIGKDPMHPLDIEGSFRMGSRDNSIKNSKLIIDGPNAIPNANEKINREISFEYLAAGKAKIRSYRGGSWDTYLDFMTSEGSNSGGEPKVRMHIAGDGKVRIGDDNLNISSNDYKLFVETGIISEKVKVAVKENWADFVFEENYALPTLSEVESFIQENHHLQDIPSAKEVEANGIDLGEMDAKLLQKIEELTLYTIEQQKEIEALKKKNTELQKQQEMIGSLLERIEKLEGRE